MKFNFLHCECKVCPVSPDLWDAYRSTDFVVKLGYEDRFILRIGVKNESFDHFLSEQYPVIGSVGWMFVTAYNPQSRQQAKEENIAAHYRLFESLFQKKITLLHGEGRSSKDTWEPERSLLAIGVSRHNALKYGAQYGQNAVVIGRINERPQLLCCCSLS